jgi:hypothetical protein
MKRIAIAAFSCGWIVPAWLSINTYLTFWHAEGWPLIRGERPLNSFPFLEFSRQCIDVAFIWLAAVIIFWSWKLTNNQDYEKMTKYNCLIKILNINISNVALPLGDKR